MHGDDPGSTSSWNRGPGAYIDGRSCHLLNQRLGNFRMEVLGRDKKFDAALLALYRAGLEYVESTATATRIAPQPQLVGRSMSDTVSTTKAAELLGVTDSAVRKAITEKRLPATKLDGRHRISRDDLAAYAAQR